ncbi:MAG: hypothetical protein SVR94_03195 [Pseudomonadota bacterium]|nr:hypothetical protein [Pseudomonadota bacterium]
MKKVKKLSAAVALALSMGIGSPANAEIALKHSGKGDALLFPVYNAYVDNYFTISNNDDKWIQGHIRFRGAGWSSELLDFDVILSPGDVFVFRVADVDGDGHWEVDQSLDKKNFMYTAKVASCKHTVPDRAAGGENRDYCMDFGTALVPNTRDGVITQATVDHHLKVGYVEFIGEAVLENMTGEWMHILLNNQGEKYQTKHGNQLGVTAWSWSDAPNQFADGQPLSDVPNVLTGTAFITLPGDNHGIAYNAEALCDFRTWEHPHRIDNYRMFHDVETGRYYSLDAGNDKKMMANRAVIVHDENVAGPGNARPHRPYGDYVFRFDPANDGANGPENRDDEAQMSFQNTWGPTLADGDDYTLSGLRPTFGNPETDDWDARWDQPEKVGQAYGLGVPNSIAEVEEAIRERGQDFFAYYFHGDSLETPCIGNNEACLGPTLTSQYFAFFPTKVYWGGSWDRYKASDLNNYIAAATRWLLERPKPYHLEVWDHMENEACIAPPPEGGFVSPYVVGGSDGGFGDGGSVCAGLTSPAVEECEAEQEEGSLFPCFTFLRYELSFFDIGNIKATFPGGAEEYQSGRVAIIPADDADDPFLTDLRVSWPALMYTFEFGSDGFIGQWRNMQH